LVAKRATHESLRQLLSIVRRILMPKKPKAPAVEPYWVLTGYQGEYSCPHGIGHGNHIHGCDGCCSRDDYPLRLHLSALDADVLAHVRRLFSDFPKVRQTILRLLGPDILDVKEIPNGKR
jgi:hypothetical protein